MVGVGRAFEPHRPYGETHKPLHLLRILIDWA